MVCDLELPLKKFQLVVLMVQDSLDRSGLRIKLMPLFLDKVGTKVWRDWPLKCFDFLISIRQVFRNVKRPVGAIIYVTE